MRARITTTTLRSILINRFFLACVAVAAISALTFAAVSQGQDPIPGTGGIEVTITYFGAVSTAPDEWLIDGTLQAENMSDVTITFGKAGSGNTTTPDPYGYFSLVLISSAGAVVSMDAADSMSSAHDEIKLEEYEL